MSLMFALLVAASAAAAPPKVPESIASQHCPGIDAAQRARYAEIEAGLTREAAWAATREIESRVNRPADNWPQSPSPRELAEHVEGWMWKQDWLTALARNEHDADELSGICAFLKRASAVVGEGPGGK